MLKHFWASFLVTILGLITAFIFGYYAQGHHLMSGLDAAFLAFLLAILETAFSFDNAVVNASILKNLTPKWQKCFLTWGMIVAVFGMRILFPLLIVSFSAWVDPWEATKIALFNHARYEEVVTAAHASIAGFGSAFLMLVGLSFFVKEEHSPIWISWIEKPLMALRVIPFISYILTFLIMAGFAFWFDQKDGYSFSVAALFGMAAYFLLEQFERFMGKPTPGKAGLATFIYLEFLDASFSFDGVIGAFAVTNDIVLIAIGLGIGAMFVRSMTVALVQGGHLSQYPYLEAGAFYAIVTLAFITALNVRIEVPEIISCLSGLVWIGGSLVYSMIENRRSLAK
ncbi:DUF475 domain-containing protein [Zymomonas mobilis]|uniref:DUF475 domain-containing protein n=1 Tax=Zymomonas mobilis subsp. mobilis (strain ATCC 10988 / DSM 424 / LMG 404 / NCIMB 8938 / NRRL B-806 / ZM1) TaxID=555217 RepID=A0A0H3G3E1_ZYMMA|nr:DUF475 domain-containing protein [Zymomonas mobilis]AEH63189.1 protein of unknown function DUF475 [Zymomonas mobilis subsp. mobilis ATCC 10988]TQL27196.1 hypothetical protein FBY55_0493 [Zymomonas mobilis]TQL28627.1 hypothetical protein FBY54_1734 [Zymomonas mobilis]